MMEDYYETSSVKKTQTSSRCIVCKKTIKAGGPSDVHTFCDGEYIRVRTHKECSNTFLNGEYCPECGDWYPHLVLDKMCEDCVKDQSPVNGHII